MSMPKSQGACAALALRHARDVLTMAANGGMPDTYWLTDSRIKRACTTLNMTPEQAREWAHDHKVVN